MRPGRPTAQLLKRESHSCSSVNPFLVHLVHLDVVNGCLNNYPLGIIRDKVYLTPKFLFPQMKQIHRTAFIIILRGKRGAISAVCTVAITFKTATVRENVWETAFAPNTELATR